MTDLGTVALDVARTLPKGQRDKLVAVVRAGDGPKASIKHQALAISAGPEFAAMVGRLFRRWEREPDVSAAGLALALEVAGDACDRDCGRTLRPVWTGPDAGQPVRLTAAVMAEVIDAAQQTLLVISFAAYKIPQVLDGLEAAAKRDVTVDIVLETAEDSGGALSFDQLPAFANLEGVRIWHWPADKRPAAGGSLHAKAIVADDKIALVTSANLTGYALANNIELGLLAYDPATASGINAHIGGLMRASWRASIPDLGWLYSRRATASCQSPPDTLRRCPRTGPDSSCRLSSLERPLGSWCPWVRCATLRLPRTSWRGLLGRRACYSIPPVAFRPCLIRSSWSPTRRRCSCPPRRSTTSAAGSTASRS